MGCCRCWAGRNCCSFHASMGSDLSKKRHASFYHILAIVVKNVAEKMRAQQRAAAAIHAPNQTRGACLP